MYRQNMDSNETNEMAIMDSQINTIERLPKQGILKNKVFN
jgi:hypothetical protein